MSRDTTERPTYTPPRVVFHNREEVLRQSGPAVGCARWGGGQGSLPDHLKPTPPPSSRLA